MRDLFFSFFDVNHPALRPKGAHRGGLAFDSRNFISNDVLAAEVAKLDILYVLKGCHQTGVGRGTRRHRFCSLFDCRPWRTL